MLKPIPIPIPYHACPFLTIHSNTHIVTKSIKNAKTKYSITNPILHIVIKAIREKDRQEKEEEKECLSSISITVIFLLPNIFVRSCEAQMLFPLTSFVLSLLYSLFALHWKPNPWLQIFPLLSGKTYEKRRIKAEIITSAAQSIISTHALKKETKIVRWYIKHEHRTKSHKSLLK